MHALVTSLFTALFLIPPPPAEARNFSNPIFDSVRPAIAQDESAPQVVQSPAPSPERPSTASPYGAFAIPRYIVMCESGGSYTAQNPRSSAGGAYAMIQSTANSAARAIGRPDLIGVRASRWPPDAQDRAASWLWDGGKGRGHWRACL